MRHAYRSRRWLLFVLAGVVGVLGTVSPAGAAHAGTAGDRNPPSMPSGLVVTAAGKSTISLKWSASHDNRGVRGYTVQRNGTLVSTSHPRARIGHLACGTSYSLGVRAFDEVGNPSPQATVIAATHACTDSRSPTKPGPIQTVMRTAKAVGVRWFPAKDDVGVVAYLGYLNGTKVGTTATNTLVLGRLQCNRSYTLSVRAADGAGNMSEPAATLVNTDRCPDTTAPTAPSKLAVTNRTASSLRLGWAASSDARRVAGYEVYRDGTLTETTTSRGVTLAGLACGGSYTLSVDAFDAASNRSPRVSIRSATTACPPATVAPVAPSSPAAPRPAPAPAPSSPAPAAPAPSPAAAPLDQTAPSRPAVSVSAAAATSITITWTAASDNVGVTGYGVYLGGATVATTTSRSRMLSGLSCGRAYTIAVDAVDAAGNRSPTSSVLASTTACPDTTAPSAPTRLTLAVANETSVGLSWTASSDNVGVVGYGIYRGGLKVDEVTATSYVLTGLGCGTTYSVAVDSVDGNGNRSASVPTFLSTTACHDTTPPSAPANLVRASVSTSAITASWAPSTDNVGVTEYGLYLNGNKTTTVASTTAVANGLSCGTQYTIGVDAADAAGNRSPKATLVTTTAACPAPAPAPAPAPPGPGTSNLVVSSSGNDSACARNVLTTPCASLGGAYAKAQGGDVVEVAAGSYGDQTVGPRSLGTTDVVFRPASGAAVTLTGLGVSATHVEFRGLRVDGVIAIQTDSATGARPSFVTLRDVTSHSAFIAADDIQLLGGNYGGFDACAANTMEDGIQIWVTGSGVPPSRVTIDGATIHDVSDHADGCSGTPQSGRHVDCIQILDGQYITIRNSRFYGCATSNILGQPYLWGLSHVTIENNFFASPVRAGNNVYLGGGSSTSCSQIVYRFNTSPGMGLTGGCSDPIATYANIMSTTACVGGVNYTNNVFLAGSAQCGSGAKVCAVSFASPTSASADFHLGATDSCARNSLQIAPDPPTDIDGQPRPSTNIDAGADEAG